jgi:isopropylmalate/homocitrate/citramalate synthase
MVGRRHQIALGKHSGAQSVNYFADQAGVTLSEAARKRVLDRIKSVAERKSGHVSEAEVIEWIRAEAAEAPAKAGAATA